MVRDTVRMRSCAWILFAHRPLRCTPARGPSRVNERSCSTPWNQEAQDARGGIAEVVDHALHPVDRATAPLRGRIDRTRRLGRRGRSCGANLKIRSEGFRGCERTI
jgi:hypothetical protein